MNDGPSLPSCPIPAGHTDRPQRPPALRQRRSAAPALPPARHTDCLYVRLPACHTALFRFLLEARENLAYFTVLDRREALLKVVFSPHMRPMVLLALEDMQRSLPLEILHLPAAAGKDTVEKDAAGKDAPGMPR